MGCDCPFIVRLFRTFRDTKYLYFLLEPCLGGDLWNLLKRQRRKYFDTDTAKFYAGDHYQKMWPLKSMTMFQDVCWRPSATCIVETSSTEI